MKTHFLVTAALAALALASCTREKADIDGKPVEVNVTILGTAPTRATSVTYANESKVANLQVYVFNNGKLEDYQDAGAAMTAQLTATSGERTVWALVNAPALKDVSTEAELKAKVSRLADNKTDAFVMSGSATQELKDGGTVPVTVKRLVSRVSINKISTDFQYALAQETLTLDGIYLINVAGDNTYAADGTPGTWVNQLGHKDNGLDAFLYDKLASTTVTNAKPYSKEHVFYPYPNPTQDDGGAARPGAEQDLRHRRAGHPAPARRRAVQADRDRGRDRPDHRQRVGTRPEHGYNHALIRRWKRNLRPCWAAS